MPHKIRKLRKNMELCVLGAKFITYAITSTYNFRGRLHGQTPRSGVSPIFWARCALAWPLECILNSRVRYNTV